MNVLTISYTVGFVLYTLLTFGWLIHVLMNKREATSMHYLITLIPFSMWVVYLIGMGDFYSGGSIYDGTTVWTIVMSTFGYINQTVLFTVLALMASGYCLLPNGMLPGRTGVIFGLAAAELILGVLGALFPLGIGKYTSFILLIVLIIQLVQLLKWANQTYAIVVQNPNANLLIGTWACSYPQRAHVAKETKKITIVYILIQIATAVAGLVLAVLVIMWAVDAINDSNNNNNNGNLVFPDILAWTAGLLIAGMIVGAFFFIFVASVWRLGTTERYALLPQHATAPVYGATGGDYAPVYGTMPPAYGTVQTAPGYAPTAY